MLLLLLENITLFSWSVALAIVSRFFSYESIICRKMFELGNMSNWVIFDTDRVDQNLKQFAQSQARGLDVLPTTISRFRNGGDNVTADLLEKVVYPEEITHCAAGVKWFKYLCSRSKAPNGDDESGEVIEKFHEIVRAYFRGPLKPPFNEAARKAAGFGPKWYEPLAVKDFTK